MTAGHLCETSFQTTGQNPVLSGTDSVGKVS